MEAPDAAAQASRVDGGAFAAWSDAGVDTYAITVRGGTHAEWTEVSYILPTTTCGTAMVDYYSLAFFDRYVHPDPERRSAALDQLLRGPIPSADERSTRTAYPWRANLFSGLSPVGDWAAANDDMPTILPSDRGTTDG